MVATAATILQTKKMFIAYYGRPADVGGLEYWADRIEDEGVSFVANAFGTSEEFSANYGSLDTIELVGGLYQQLFGRNADESGLEFYVNGILTGRYTLANVALALIDGVPVGSQDEATVANRVSVADYVMWNAPGSTFLLEILDDVTHRITSVTTAIELLQSELNDDFPSNTPWYLPDPVFGGGGGLEGSIGFPGDEDWFAVYLDDSHRYKFDLLSSNSSEDLFQSSLSILNAQENIVITKSLGGSSDIELSFTPLYSDVYFVSVSGDNDAIGTYFLDVNSEDLFIQPEPQSATPITLIFDDPTNELLFFEMEIINNIQAAWDKWDVYIDGHENASIEFVIRSINDSGNLALANASSSKYLYNNVWQGNVEYELISGEDITGANFDAQILISTHFLNQENYYDFTIGDGTPANQINFEELMIHEIGHVLGFNGWFDNPDYTSPYEELVDKQLGVFLGDYAVAANGGAVSIDLEGLYHLDDGAFGSAPMSTFPNYGGGEIISNVEIAILADIGLPVNEQYIVT
jgi:hypothetical protein